MEAIKSISQTFKKTYLNELNFKKMKRLYIVFIALFISSSTLVSANDVTKQQDEKVIAVYNGVTDEGKYKFTNDQKTVLLFDELGDDVTIDLYEEEYIGKKFSITWEEEEYDLMDDDGETTGEVEVVRTILEIEELD
jgi:hypothetical protein